MPNICDTSVLSGLPLGVFTMYYLHGKNVNRENGFLPYLEVYPYTYV